MRNMILGVVVVGTVAAGAWWALAFRVETSRRSAGRAPVLSSTSRHGLDDLIAKNRARGAKDAGDGAAAVVLADALMRAARVTSDPSLPLEAERALRATLAHNKSDYPAQRMLSVVYASQHRFAEALEAAR